MTSGTPPADAPLEPPRDYFLPAFVVCALVALVPLWSATYLPMTDLPQHAAQIFFWQHHDDPAYDLAARTEFQWFTPYLLGYALWRLLAFVLPIPVGAQVLASVAVLAWPLAFLVWFRRTGQTDRWWALLGFPLAYSFSFYFGFLNYLLALPLSLLALASGWRYAQAPDARGGWLLVLWGAVLFAAHGLTLGFVLPILASLILLQAPDVRAGLRRLWPLACWLLLIAAYAVAYLRMCEQQQWVDTREHHWDLSWIRLVFLPHMLIGFPQDWLGASWVLAAALTAGYVLRPVRSLSAWTPAAWALGAFLLGPDTALGTNLLCYRFAAFLPPFALAGLREAGSPARTRVVRVVLVALTLFWLGVLSVRFRGFEEEARAFAPVLQRLPPQKKVLPLIFDSTSAHVSGLPYLHFATWYEVEKGGRAGFSFLDFGRGVLRSRPGVRKLADERLQMSPGTFTWEEGRAFDYFLVRAKEDKGPRLFAEADAPVVCVLQSGEWYLYEARREAAGP
jgi:hypothetical protein